MATQAPADAISPKLAALERRLTSTVHQAVSAALADVSSAEADKASRQVLEHVGTNYATQLDKLRAEYAGALSTADASDGETLKGVRGAVLSFAAAPLRGGSLLQNTPPLPTPWSLPYLTPNSSHTYQATAALEAERTLHAESLERLQASHTAQVKSLTDQLTTQRREASKATAAMEESLDKTYTAKVDALKSEVQDQQAAHLQRALGLLERSVLADAEASTREHAVVADAEVAASEKFRALSGTLRTQWASEEKSRVAAFEAQLRAQYDAGLAQAQTQLEMALTLNDDAETAWMSHAEERAGQQLEAMSKFEARCRRVYEERLNEYMESTDSKIKAYEEQVLTTSGSLAHEQSKHQSQLRRLKLACNKWRVDYQKEVMSRYHTVVSDLEARYMREMSSMLDELSETQHELTSANRTLSDERRKRRTELQSGMKTHPDAGANADSERKALLRQSQLHKMLNKLWDGLSVPMDERLEVLQQLLASADYSPSLLSAYESTHSRLSSQLQLVQLVTRRDFLRYRLAALKRTDSAAAPQHVDTGPNAEELQLESELRQVESELLSRSEAYEQKNGEPFEYKTYTFSNATQQAAAGGGR